MNNLHLPTWLIFCLVFILTWGNTQRLSAQCSASAAFSIQQPNACAQQAVTFTATDPNATSYAWRFTGGAGPTTGVGRTLVRSFPALNVAYPITAELTVTGVDTLGNPCTVTSTQTIQVLATPEVVVIDTNSFNPFNGCTTDSTLNSYSASYMVQIPATGPYTWDFGDGSPSITSTVNTQDHTYNGYGNYFLTVSVDNGTCVGRFEQPIYFQLPPIANMNLVGGFNICEDQTIQVQNQTDTSNRKVDRYIWDWGNGDRDTVFDKNAIFYNYTYTDEAVCDSMLNLQGKFTEEVRLIVQNGCGEHYNASPVFVDPLPRAFVGGPGLGCENTLLSFANNSCPENGVLYTWDFGDGSPQIGPLNNSLSRTHAYANTGTYQVNLIACKPACNACDTARHTITILDPPTANFSPTPDEGCAPLIVDFTNQSVPTRGASYTWTITPSANVTFLDSTTRNDFEPRIQIQDSGTYVIQLRVENICGFDIHLDTIRVSSPPQISLAPIPDTCGFLDYIPVVTYNPNGNPITSYEWTFSNGTPGTSTVAFPPGPITFLPDTHTVRIRVQNLCGFTSAVQSFVVAPALSFISAGNDFDLCINEDTTLVGLPLGVGTWEGPDIDTAGVFTPAGPGVYSLVYSSGAGNCRVADTIEVIVRDIPPVSVITADQTLCEGDSPVLLQATPASGTWDVGLLAGDFYDPIAPIDIFARYTVLDSLGCQNQDSLRIEVNMRPVVSTQDTVFCQGTSILSLDNYSPRAGGTGFWTGLKIQDAVNGTFLPDSVGNYQLVYTFTNLDNCADSDTMNVTVVAGAIAAAGPDTSLCRNENYVVLNQASPPGGTWFNGTTALPADTFFFAGMPAGNNTLTYRFGAGSCLTTDDLIVEIRDTLAVDAGPDILFCDGATTLTLSASPANGTWVDGIGFISMATGLYDPGSIPVGSQDVLRYVVQANNCVSQDIRIVTVDSLPTISFVVDTACVNQVVPFTENTIYTSNFLWDFGDGTTSTLPNPTHTYTASGDYSVKLVGTNVNGCKDSLIQDIHITEAPFADFDKSTQSGCAPLTLNFTDQSIARQGSYTWIMGNGDTLTGPNPGPVTYQQGTNDTTYYIRLIIQNSCSTVEKLDSVIVFPQPNVIIGTDFSTGCSPLLINYANLTTGNADTYSWDLGKGGPLETDSLPGPRYYIADSMDSVYTIILTATNTCGSDTDSVEIVVSPNDLDPIFNTSATQGCMPFTVDFTNLSGASIVSWDYGDNSTNMDVGIQQPSHTFTDSGTYTIRMFVDNGCSKDTGEVTIVVHPQEISSFLPPDPVCVGEAMTFMPQPGGNISGYRWDFGDGDSSFATTASHIYTAPGTYQVSLTSFSQFFQCPNSWDTTVTVNALPNASFSLADTAGCQPFALQLRNSPIGLTYIYDFGNGDSATSINPAYTYRDAGNYVLRLTTEDGNGCRADTSANITVHTLPNSDFVASADTSCGPASIRFTNLSSPSVRSFWTFGTGNVADTSVLLNPDFFYPNTGTYQVQLHSTNVFGCQDSIRKSILILPQPVAVMQVDTMQGCQPLTVDFSQSSTGASRYTWRFGDQSGPVTALDPPPHIYFGGDVSYTASLVVDTAGFCFDSTSVQIDLASNPTASFIPINQEACGADTVIFTNTSSSAVRPLTYLWDFGNGNQSFAAQPGTQIFPNAQVYSINLIATNDFGCADTFINDLQVYPQPVADFSLSDSLICVSEVIDFTNLSTNYTNSQWRFGDQQFSFDINTSHIYGLADTVLFVELRVDTAGFCVDSVRKRIETASLPRADFSFGPDNFCGAATVAFTNLSTTQDKPISYAWTFGNGLSSAEENPTSDYAVSESPEYFPVRLLTTNSFGCMDTADQIVTGIPQPVAAFEALPTNGCSDQLVQFRNYSQDFNTSTWNFGNGSFSIEEEPVAIYPTGTYSVELVISYNNLCFDQLRLTDYIEVQESADARFTYDLTTTTPPDGTVAFTNLSQNATQYQWLFGDGSGSDEVNPTHQYFVNDTFSVSLIANNAVNCPDTLTQELRPMPFGGIFVPNAFMPGSGVDSTDVFLPVGIGLVEWEIAIYDTWGNRVWYSTALGEVGTPQEGRPSEAWDGTIQQGVSNGKDGPLATPNVFVWKIQKAVFQGGRPYRGVREGTVTILR